MSKGLVGGMIKTNDSSQIKDAPMSNQDAEEEDWMQPTDFLSDFSDDEDILLSLALNRDRKSRESRPANMIQANRAKPKKSEE